ncbi:MAG: DUF4007 family protein [Armatimonadota bacterium]
MANPLTSTKHFGFSAAALAEALAYSYSHRIRSFGGNPDLAHRLGLGVTQLEALGAWMRLSGLLDRSQGVTLSPLGRSVVVNDPSLSDTATWWCLHWELSRNYVVWAVLAVLGVGGHVIEEIDATIQRIAPQASRVTIANARKALIRALDETPLGRELGLVELHSDGRRITGLTKLAVRHGQAPMAAVAYALLDWSEREQMPSASLESLVAPGSPGRAFHMSEGAMERYLMEIDGAFRGRVLSYSRTAGLNEAYFKRDVTPLQVLASHYLHARDGLPWTDALDRAQAETGALDETDDG